MNIYKRVDQVINQNSRETRGVKVEVQKNRHSVYALNHNRGSIEQCDALVLIQV